MRRKTTSYFQKKKRIELIALGWVLIIIGIVSNSVSAQSISPIKLSWLGGKAPALSTGVSWGVPLPEGKVDPSSGFSLKDSRGQAMPVQSWPLAYWPDGSLKWIGLSTVADTDAGTTFELEPEKKSGVNPLKSKIEVTETGNDVLVNTGVIQCDIPKHGNRLIRFIKIDGKEISTGGRLVCISQNGPSRENGPQPARVKYIGNTEKVTVEQNGPVRAVVKIEGKHVSASGNRSWLPFIVRLYFYAGQQSIRMVHTFIYDGNQKKDFIRGLGLVFDVPLNEQLYNRHIRFSGNNGRLWVEPCEPLTGRYPLDRFQETYRRQLTGKRIPELDTFSKRQQFLIDNWASWNDYKLEQLNADGFTVQKRTNDASTWINAGWGRRSQGMAFVGDVSGGLAVCIHNFWQLYPTALEINNVKKDTAQLKAWLWSPQAKEMDMRNYDTLGWGHNLLASYEDVQPGFSTATGVGRTTEIMLYASADVPSYDTLSEISRQENQPPLLTASPEYIHSIPVFGIWSLPDRSTKGKRWIEDQLDKAFKYYKLEVEQRHWYGFWNFGDVRHSYDPVRHTWKYDIGGFAWDNTELMTPMWLWYSYLRTGREDVFRMAEAMTRNTDEVDVYHLGLFKGLGSRHNVIHWGGGAKEVRISQAALSRFYYYLTTDERTGDLMQTTANASSDAIGRIDPLRHILKKSKYPTHIRFGPDWLALVGNWMTAWERTGNTKYRNRIMVGVNCFYNMPYGFYSGKDAAFGYDPETYKVYQLNKDDIGWLHLSVLMGGPEVAFELTPLLQNKKWDKLWLQFCKLYGGPKSEVEKTFGRDVQLGQPGSWYARLPAYYAYVTGDTAYANRAWDEFLNSRPRYYHTDFTMKKFNGIQSLEPIYEVRGVSTNNTAQWCLNAIELLQMVPNQLPENNPQFSDTANNQSNINTGSIDQYKKSKLLYQDNFDHGMKNWVVETPSSPYSKVDTKDGKLDINVDHGATVWLKKKLSGNILIEYHRKVIMDGGHNDRLSDMNQFWMATDPRQTNIFTRSGKFSEYDSLQLYYAGIGGNSNSTTRFRKYQGNGERTLLFDFRNKQHLLQPNKNYYIQIVVYNGTTKVFVDGEQYFSYTDEEPLTQGYFGFRTVKSHQEIGDFKVYRLR